MYQRDYVLELDHVGSSPVLDVLHVAAGHCGDHQVGLSQRHVDHAILEVQLLLDLVLHVSDLDAELILQANGQHVRVQYLPDH